MSARPSIARELVELFDAMPNRFADVDVRAGWIARKADLMRRIAAETDDPTTARQAAAEADRADRQAADLIAGSEAAT